MDSEDVGVDAHLPGRPRVRVIGDPSALLAFTHLAQKLAADSRLAASLAHLKAVSQDHVGLIGCDPSDVVDIHGEKFGDLTAEQVVETAHRTGLRGREAVQAAYDSARLEAAPVGLTKQTNRAPNQARTPGQRHRRVARTTSRRRARSPARSADDPEPEPPPSAPLTPADRRALRQLVDQTARAVAARYADWRLCSRCQREQEPEEFSLGATYCRSCERERLKVYRQSRQAVAA